VNQKKAKKLRNQAQAATTGLPDVKYIHGRTPMFRANFDPSGMPLGYSKVALGVPTIIDKDCTRYVYQKLKRAA